MSHRSFWTLVGVGALLAWPVLFPMLVRAGVLAGWWVGVADIAMLLQWVGVVVLGWANILRVPSVRTEVLGMQILIIGCALVLVVFARVLWGVA